MPLKFFIRLIAVAPVYMKKQVITEINHEKGWIECFDLGNCLPEVKINYEAIANSRRLKNGDYKDLYMPFLPAVVDEPMRKTLLAFTADKLDRAAFPRVRAPPPPPPPVVAVGCVTPPLPSDRGGAPESSGSRGHSHRAADR